jgi:hypothetical protein
MHNNDFGAMFDDVQANSSGEGSSNDDGGQGSDDVNDIGVDDCGDDDDDYDSSEADELVGSAKRLEKFETVKKAAKENVCPHSKGCPKHWIVLRFILEMLILLT